jgi:uncharacterized membrane protein YphA (DoxX/SURF4 family)
MNVALWIVTVLLAVVFLAAGSMKLARSKEQLHAAGQIWSDGFSPGAIKALGIAEILGAVGLILPAVTGIAVVLVPLAAAGLALDMAGAFITHGRLKQRREMVVTAVLFALAVFVAWGRFGPYPIG